MNLTGPVEHDEDGNDLPVPSAESDLGQLIQLLEYARLRGYRIGPTVQIGKITLQVRDLRQAEGRGTQSDDYLPKDIETLLSP